jgi:hypothetical protein
MVRDRLEEFGIYNLAFQVFDDFRGDSEIMMKDARGEARESKGRYRQIRFLLPLETVNKRRTVLDRSFGGSTTTINTIEGKSKK